MKVVAVVIGIHPTIISYNHHKPQGCSNQFVGWLAQRLPIYPPLVGSLEQPWTSSSSYTPTIFWGSWASPCLPQPQEREEARLRRFRESQFMDSMRCLALADVDKDWDFMGVSPWKMGPLTLTIAVRSQLELRTEFPKHMTINWDILAESSWQGRVQ